MKQTRNATFSAEAHSAERHEARSAEYFDFLYSPAIERQVKGAKEKEFTLCGLISVALAPVPSTNVETTKRSQ